MNLANKITLSRIGLTFVFMFFLFSQGLVAKYLALITFVFASLTDLLDGHIARKRKTENDFGRLMDPIADKILVLAAFLAFVEMKIIPAWMVIIIIFRELVITGLRIIAATRGKVLSASLAGKHKTVSQMVAIISILIFLIIKESAQGLWGPVWELWFERSVFYLMLVTVIFTLISGLSYIIRNKPTLFNANAKPH
ncbi:MAG: CDP-diacylglycerol--glycerol-3-phosphate 3-phosphatidyltransferase [Omnitrophica bacterium]|nr:CDP-diacylglycerol--glycerol-3-phosphate 3-phosphatidyltransferase [Candidatus Omnitrophota bacterium]